MCWMTGQKLCLTHSGFCYVQGSGRRHPLEKRVVQGLTLAPPSRTSVRLQRGHGVEGIDASGRFRREGIGRRFRRSIGPWTYATQPLYYSSLYAKTAYVYEACYVACAILSGRGYLFMNYWLLSWRFKVPMICLRNCFSPRYLFKKGMLEWWSLVK